MSDGPLNLRARERGVGMVKSRWRERLKSGVVWGVKTRRGLSPPTSSSHTLAHYKRRPPRFISMARSQFTGSHTHTHTHTGASLPPTFVEKPEPHYTFICNHPDLLHRNVSPTEEVSVLCDHLMIVIILCYSVHLLFPMPASLTSCQCPVKLYI